MTDAYGQSTSTTTATPTAAASPAETPTPAGTGTLPNTGSNVGELTQLALVMLVVGIALTAAGRYRDAPRGRTSTDKRRAAPPRPGRHS